MRRRRPSSIGYRGPQVKAQQAEIRRVLRFGGDPHSVVASSHKEGQVLPAAVRSHAESVQRASFSSVRVHPDAATVTTPLQARAVTHRQHIYFHPNEYTPGTPTGNELIAHELAHTLQTRQTENGAATSTGQVSEPGDAVERNAHALARGETTHALAAPAGVVLRSPFDNESADERARRQHLLTSISNAVNQLLRMLQSSGLIENVEVPIERAGVRGIIYGAHTAGTADEQFSSYSDRDARVHRIIRSLMEMGTLYRGRAIAADFSAPTLDAASGEYQSNVEYTAGADEINSSFGGASEEWVDLQAAYERYRVALGRTSASYDADWYYLDPRIRIDTHAARDVPRASRGIGIGAYIVVPDVDNDPLNYWLLDGYRRAPRGATIIEVWSDDFGYYYMRGERRIDVPSPWGS